MKKILALILALSCIFACLVLTACDDKNGDGDRKEESKDSGENKPANEYKFRLPENVTYKYQSVNGDYQDLTVTKIGDEYCLNISGQITFYRKNAEGMYDYWLQSGDSWMKISTFDEEMFSMLLSIGTDYISFEDMEKIGTDTVCGLSAEIFKSKYLDSKTYIHSGSDGVFIVKTTVGTSTDIEITEWTTENIVFPVDKPE